MREADPKNTPPSRRGVLSLAGLLPLAIVPSGALLAAPFDADRDLLALCAEFDRLEAAYAQTDFGAPVGDAEREAVRDADQERIGEAQRVLAERIHAIRAVTPAGHAARAASLAGWAPDLMEAHGDIETLLRSAILRDLADIPVIQAQGVECPPPAVPPEDVEHDKALMATCRQHVAELQAFNADRSGSEGQDQMWDEYWRTGHAIDGAKPRTLAGIYAKARAAKAHADLPLGRDGGAGVRWALDVVDDLLRLAGEG